MLFVDDGTVLNRDSQSRHFDDAGSILIEERPFAAVANYDADDDFSSVDRWQMKKMMVAAVGVDRTNQLCVFRCPMDNHLGTEAPLRW